MLAAGCGDGEQRPPASQAPPRPSKPTLRLFALTDPSGYLEPCGCQKRPLGGIDKAATKLAELSADGVPALLLAAGDLFFESGGAHGEEAPGLEKELRFQQDAQAETLADAFARLGLAAAVAGPADAAHVGAPSTQALAQRGRFALLEPGTPREGEVIERGGVRVGLFGLGGAAAADARAATVSAQRQVDALRAEGAQVVVALLSAEARTARRIAGGVKGLDFALHGGIASASVAPPERIGSTTLLRASHDGHGLLVVDLFRAGDGGFADISAWTREREQRGLETRIDELRTRLAAWEHDPKADPKLVAEQRAKLKELQAQRAGGGPEASGTAASGNAFSARFVELDPDVASEPTMRALLDAHYARINDHNRTALAGVAPLPVKAGDPGYVGSARCGECHESEHAWWKGHAHGKAYATLVERNKQFNLTCVACHVTGYGKPGGAAVVQNAGLVDVGCESCHGPGSLHAKDQDVDAKKNVVREVPEAVCKGCHNPQHSDAFVYAEYREKLIVPGHGLPEAATP